jgi:hypothetical protein
MILEADYEPEPLEADGDEEPDDDFNWVQILLVAHHQAPSPSDDLEDAVNQLVRESVRGYNL